jgi:hypothetical protein
VAIARPLKGDAIITVKANALAALSLEEGNPLEWLTSTNWQFNSEIVCGV